MIQKCAAPGCVTEINILDGRKGRPRKFCSEHSINDLYQKNIALSETYSKMVADVMKRQEKLEKEFAAIKGGLKELKAWHNESELNQPAQKIIDSDFF